MTGTAPASAEVGGRALRTGEVERAPDHRAVRLGFGGIAETAPAVLRNPK